MAVSSSFFRPATRKKSRLRLALDGPAGSGKTFTALRFAFAIAGPGGRVAVINTESGAVEKYEGLSPDGIEWKFQVGELDNYSPSTYTEAIQLAGKLGFSVIVIDSLSHAWQGDGGALDQVSRKGGNSFTAWKDVTPQHNRMIEAILKSPAHIIATMRTKMEYILEEHEKNGRTISVPKKVGMAPIQRAGMEYEFDVVADIDQSHTLTVSKTRCPLIDGKIVVKPGASFIEPVMEWLNEGAEVDPSYYATEPEQLKSVDPARGANDAPAVDWREAARQKAAGNGGKDLASASAPETVEQVAAVGQVEEQVDQSEQPPFDTPADPGPATVEQVATIKRLFLELKTPVETQIGILARRGVLAPEVDGVPAVAHLGADAAADLIPKLTAMLEEARRDELGVTEEHAARAGANIAPDASTSFEAAPKNRCGRRSSGLSSRSMALTLCG